METVIFELEDAPNGVAVNSDCASKRKIKAIAVCCIRKLAASESANKGLDTIMDDISSLVYSSKLD